ncbi:MAG: hypothetical protein RL264_805 [Bacteroidota bacterium]
MDFPLFCLKFNLVVNFLIFLVQIKVNMLKIKLVLSLLAVVVLSACGKYEDGPSMSLMSKKSRLCNDWTLNYVLKNTNDITDETKTHKFVIEKDGTFSSSGVYNSLGQLHGDYTHGKWEFSADKTQLLIYENEDEDPTHTYTIKELRNKSLTIVERFPSINLSYTYNYIAE